MCGKPCTGSHSYPMFACKHSYDGIYSFGNTEETHLAHKGLVSVWCYGERHQSEEKATLGDQPALVRSRVEVKEKHVFYSCVKQHSSL